MPAFRFLKDCDSAARLQGTNKLIARFSYKLADRDRSRHTEVLDHFQRSRPGTTFYLSFFLVAHIPKEESMTPMPV